MNIIPNVPPKAFSFSAVAIGYLLIDDLTANEQNALGNWLMLVAQVICTNAFYKQVQAERANINSNYSNMNYSNMNYSNEYTIEMMQKMIKAMQQEIENLKRNL